MIAFAIIVFREVLEIALVLGVLLAATRQLAKRNRWITFGMLTGIVGSVVVAFFAQKISDAMEGMGQEVFNATVLLLAAVLIAWTVVWMRRHATSLSKELKEVGRAVTQGEKPLYTLAVVIALTVLRDGSEVVMLTHGSLASGQSGISVILGGAIGLALGALVGVGICYGILKFTTKHIFNVTSWMLILLAAGMVSQAVGYLSSAGYVPEIISPLWDTSAIMAENSFVGRVLHTLVGYTARPSGIQMLCYVLTIICIGLILRIYGNIQTIAHSMKTAAAVIIFLCAGILMFPQEAHATKKVYSPYVEKGELELEARGSVNFDNRPDVDNLQKQKYALGYGVTDRWFTEVYGEVEKERNDDGEDLNFRFTEAEWENRFQLTEKGQYPVDVGFQLEYAVSAEDKHPDNLEWLFLFAKDIGKTTHYANFKFGHTVGGGHSNETEGGFAWSSRYRLHEKFEPGFEYHADFGGLNEGKSYNEQSHQAGPVFYGKIGPVKYDVGYLFGASDAAPEGMLKWILEYEMHF